MTLSLSEVTRVENEWDADSVLPDMWDVLRACERAGLDIIDNTQTIMNWYIFLQQHGEATLEEFLRNFDEGAKKKDFYEFSKYCIRLYRKVHNKQLAEETNPRWRAFIEEQMQGTVEMDQLGDQYREESGNDYWQKNASIVSPEKRELPRPYVKLLGAYRDIGEFMEAYKKFDRSREPPSIADEMRRLDIQRRTNGTSNGIRRALGSERRR